VAREHARIIVRAQAGGPESTFRAERILCASGGVRLLGARLLAPEGGEQIMEAALAIRYGIGVSGLVAPLVWLGIAGLVAASLWDLVLRSQVR
jgi:hypothetical protein